MNHLIILIATLLAFTSGYPFKNELHAKLRYLQKRGLENPDNSDYTNEKPIHRIPRFSEHPSAKQNKFERFFENPEEVYNDQQYVPPSHKIYRRQPEKLQKNQQLEKQRSNEQQIPDESILSLVRNERQSGGGGDHDTVDFGAHTGEHGAFEWHAEYPVIHHG